MVTDVPETCANCRHALILEGEQRYYYCTELDEYIEPEKFDKYRCDKYRRDPKTIVPGNCQSCGGSDWEILAIVEVSVPRAGVFYTVQWRCLKCGYIHFIFS